VPGVGLEVDLHDLAGGVAARHHVKEHRVGRGNGQQVPGRRGGLPALAAACQGGARTVTAPAIANSWSGRLRQPIQSQP
jgi:hypothetical protein